MKFLIIYVLYLHWLGDFVFQSQELAKNKHRDTKILAKHCLIYTSILFLGVLNFKYALLMGFLHFCVDYITCRINAYFYNKGDIHNFFVSIGFDQLIHASILILFLPLL